LVEDKVEDEGTPRRIERADFEILPHFFFSVRDAPSPCPSSAPLRRPTTNHNLLVLTPR